MVRRPGVVGEAVGFACCLLGRGRDSAMRFVCCQEVGQASKKEKLEQEIHFVDPPGHGAGDEKFTLWQTIGLNSMNMFGTGPFITIPLVIGSCRPAGPQALIAYGVVSLACICDACIWGELGSRWPSSGASYIYLKELYGPDFGPLMSFIYIWQFFVTSPANVASGFIAMAQYLTFITGKTDDGTQTWLAVAFCLICLPVCYRPVSQLGRITLYLSAVTVLAVVFVLYLGFSNVAPHNYHIPHDAFASPGSLLWSFSLTCRLGMYDYTGYYDVNMMADEVANPRKTIPISVIVSVIITAGVFFALYGAVLGSLPWDGPYGFVATASDDRGIISVLVDTYLGRGFANFMTLVVVVTIFSSNFSMLTGFAHVPYAAARDGYFYSFLGKMSTRHAGLPANALLLLWGLSLFFCFLPLGIVIDAMTCLMLLIQFIAQAVGLLLYRPPDDGIGYFRIPLFPLPVYLQLIVFTFIFVGTENYLLMGGAPVMELSLAFLALGVLMGLVRARSMGQWPFRAEAANNELSPLRKPLAAPMDEAPCRAQ